MAPLYDWGASAVRYKVPTSSLMTFNSGLAFWVSSSSMPTEMPTGSWTAGVNVLLAEGLDPCDNLGSSSRCMGGMSLFEQAEHQRGCEVLGCAGVLGLRSWGSASMAGLGTLA